jgi:Peptidase family C25
MKSATLITAVIVGLATTSFADNEVITAFKDPTISCDYLIVSPSAFQMPAVMLAQHRNTFKNDDVEHAKVAFLEDILTAFPGKDYNHRNEALWDALKWAKQNWRMSFKYLVLMGSDAFVVEADSSVYSDGLMPTWYAPTKLPPNADYQNQDFPVAVSDDCYGRLSYAASTADIWSGINDTGISIGRIPAQTVEQCSLYVEKVKRFDLSRPKGVWRNTVMAIADDAMQGAYPDPLGAWHQASAELVDSTLQGYLVRKRYLSAYPPDEFYEKPLTAAAIMQTISRGAALAFFYGHGNDQQLTDENVLNSGSTNLFTNDSMPFVLVAFTSDNGQILNNTPVPMSQKFLFTPQGGAVAYIGSACETYASDNAYLGMAFFSQLKQHPSASFGALLAQAKLEPNGSSNAATYFFLGDPALRATFGSINITVAAVPDSAPTALRITVPHDSSSQISYSACFTVRDSVNPDPASGFPPNMGFAFDSSISVKSGVLQYSVDVPLPQAPQAAQKAIVYVWNDSVDGHAEVIIGAGSAGIINPVHLNGAFPKVSVKVENVRLVVSGLPAGSYSISIFDVHGRVVLSSEQEHRGGFLSVPLQERTLSSGRYFLRIRSGKSDALVPFMHVTGM